MKYSCSASCGAERLAERARRSDLPAVLHMDEFEKVAGQIRLLPGAITTFSNSCSVLSFRSLFIQSFYQIRLCSSNSGKNRSCPGRRASLLHLRMMTRAVPASAGASTPKVLSLVDLRKVYGDTVAVDGVSFDVGRNEIVGLLGPNGAGKTTTINMILGVLEPSAGTIHIEGLDIATHRSPGAGADEFRRGLRAAAGQPDGLPEPAVLRPALRRDEILRRGSTNCSGSSISRRFRHTKCGVLSSGEQTRVGPGQGDAQPAAPAAARRADRLARSRRPPATSAPRIREFAAQEAVGVLWTSHNMHEVEEVCDRVLFLSHGRILLEGDPKTLPREHGKETLEELFITVAREPLTLGNNAVMMHPQPHRRHRPPPVLPPPRQPRAPAAPVRLGGDRHRAVGLHHPLPERRSTPSGLNFVPTLLGAVLLWDFFTRVMHGVTTTFLEDVWSRNFLNLFATPLSISEYLARPGDLAAS